MWLQCGHLLNMVKMSTKVKFIIVVTVILLEETQPHYNKQEIEDAPKIYNNFLETFYVFIIIFAIIDFFSTPSISTISANLIFP